jgi:drug/metabolite transporter (DMT)-like permease
MAVIFNTLNAKLFFGQQVSTRFYPAALLGGLGIIALFWHDVIGSTLNNHTLMGIGLCVLGTYGFSLGNMISARHQKKVGYFYHQCLWHVVWFNPDGIDCWI